MTPFQSVLLFSLPEPYSIGRLRHPHSSNVFFSETTEPIEAKFYMEPSWVGGTKVCSGILCHMTNMAATPIYGKNPSKIFFSGTKGPVTLGLGMQHWRLGPNKVSSNDDLQLTLIFFTARSNLLPYAFIWKNIHFFRKNVRKSFNGRNLQQMTKVTRCFC